MKKRLFIILLLPLIITGCNWFNKEEKEVFPEIEETSHTSKELICSFKDTMLSSLKNAETTIVFYFGSDSNVLSATYKEELSKELSSNELYIQAKNECSKGNCTTLYQNDRIINEGILTINDITKYGWNNQNKEQLKNSITNTYQAILISCE